jgi:hypothetical protein
MKTISKHCFKRTAWGDPTHSKCLSYSVIPSFGSNFLIEIASAHSQHTLSETRSTIPPSSKFVATWSLPHAPQRITSTSEAPIAPQRRPNGAASIGWRCFGGCRRWYERGCPTKAYEWLTIRCRAKFLSDDQIRC